MDVSRAHRSLRATSSTTAHRRLGAPARVDPTAFDETAADSDDDDDFGVEMPGVRVGGGRASPPMGEQHVSFEEQMRRRAAPPPKPPRPPSGYFASIARGQKELERERERERQRVEAATPKNIEAALKEQRDRNRRRKRVKAVCPNPVRRVRRFLRDPVTRFWLGCNICCLFMLFATSFGFMWLFYPVLLQPTLKY